MTRMTPLSPPYPPDTAAMLAKWMPPGADGMEPLALFRLLAVHDDLFGRMRPLGAGLLGRPRLSVRDREILILRTTARAGAGYEWGVHVTGFGALTGLDDAQIRSTAVGGPEDPCWDDPHDRHVLALADALHEGCDVDDAVLAALRTTWTDDLVLEAVICCGWYRLLSGVINVGGLDPEPWAAPFPSLG